MGQLSFYADAIMPLSLVLPAVLFYHPFFSNYVGGQGGGNTANTVGSATRYLNTPSRFPNPQKCFILLRSVN